MPAAAKQNHVLDLYRRAAPSVVALCVSYPAPHRQCHPQCPKATAPCIQRIRLATHAKAENYGSHDWSTCNKKSSTAVRSRRSLRLAAKQMCLPSEVWDFLLLIVRAFPEVVAAGRLQTIGFSSHAPENPTVMIKKSQTSRTKSCPRSHPKNLRQLLGVTFATSLACCFSSSSPSCLLALVLLCPLPLPF